MELVLALISNVVNHAVNFTYVLLYCYLMHIPEKQRTMVNMPLMGILGKIFSFQATLAINDLI